MGKPTETHRVICGNLTEIREHVLTKDTHSLMVALNQRKRILETFDLTDNQYTCIESDYGYGEKIRSYYIAGSIKMGCARSMSDREINQLNRRKV